jgi:bacterioferritin (cytochrome b1)
MDRSGKVPRGKIDDEMYDVITVLHHKSQGLEALEQYLQDVQNQGQVREIFDEIRQQDEEAVHRLETCLRELVMRERDEEEDAA